MSLNTDWNLMEGTDYESYFSGVTLEEYYAMTTAQRENLLKSAMASMTEEQIVEFQTVYTERMDFFRKELIVFQDELEAILNSSSASVEEISRATSALEDIDAHLAFVKDEKDLETSTFGDAQTELGLESIDATDGEDYTFPSGDYDNGQETVIDTTHATTTSENPEWAEDVSENAVDQDGDGVKETLTDADGDGIADDDFNHDNVISEADLNPEASTSDSQLITIEVETTDTVEVASYDAETGTIRFCITKEDGTVYYVTVKSNGEPLPNIKFSHWEAIDNSSFESLVNTEVLHRIYTDFNSEYPLGHYMDSVDPSAAGGKYYTIIDATQNSTYTDTTSGSNIVTIDPTDEDFQNTREYEITCDGNYLTQEILNLNFPDDADLEFAQDPNTGDIIITATTSEGTVTVRIKNYGGTFTDELISDEIHIDGGIITQEDYEDINNILYHYVADLSDADGSVHPHEVISTGTIFETLYVESETDLKTQLTSTGEYEITSELVEIIEK